MATRGRTVSVSCSAAQAKQLARALRAYVDAELAIGSVGDAVQIGWDSANLALLRQ